MNKRRKIYWIYRDKYDVLFPKNQKYYAVVKIICNGWARQIKMQLDVKKIVNTIDTSKRNKKNNFPTSLSTVEKLVREYQ